MYLGMLYHLIQVFKGHDDFAEELSKWTQIIRRVCVLNCAIVSMEPPLPVYLFTVVANMREKLAKGYPMKKVSDNDQVLVYRAYTYVFSFCLCCGRRYYPSVEVYEKLPG